MKKLKNVVLPVAAAVLTLLAGSGEASATGAVTRTFSAYDLTQCSCVYSAPGYAYAWVKSAPLVTVTSYYDSSFTGANISTYQRPTGIDQYVLVGYYDNHQVLANNGNGGVYNYNYVLCWTDDQYGNQIDKVAAKAYVNSTTARLYLFYVADAALPDGVRYAGHHC